MMRIYFWRRNVACTGEKNGWRILVANFEVKRQLGRCKYRQEDNTKHDIRRNRMWWCGLD
jgi:hypothetical protein